ncbi:MAG: type II secretion system F family protein [Blastocatellia bacterium]|nr:type II secretion system F family protein [Blastocatellia bacterium]MBL8192822.1 type II secretion system F family protein [Blastocatellia bacterium]
MWFNKTKEIATFYEKMAQSYRAGLPIIESLSLASMNISNTKLRQSLDRAKSYILNGSTFTEGLAQSPTLFPEFDLAIIEVGESQGRLDQTLLDLSQLYERQYKDIKIFLFAMAYPTFLLGAAIFLPPIVAWFTDGLSAYVSIVTKKLFTLAIPITAIYTGYYAFKVYGPDTLDYVILQIPIIGTNLKKLALARFGRSLAVLFSSGIDLRRGIKLAIKSMSNSYLENRSKIIAVALDEGRTITEGLQAANVFPEAFVQAFAIGEQTGDIDKMLHKVAEYYEFEADKAFKAILAAVPIVVYLAVALYIAYIVISFYTGYFNAIGNITNQ